MKPNSKSRPRDITEMQTNGDRPDGKEYNNRTSRDEINSPVARNNHLDVEEM